MTAKTYTYFLVLLLGLAIRVNAQSFTEPSKIKQNDITVNNDNYTVKAQVLSHEKKLKVNNSRTYSWYAYRKIMETKGGYDGKLLHGLYRSFYLNDQLKEKGEFKYGLKHKQWKYWYPDGKLKEVIHWKNGVKNGAYELYNDYGQIMAKGTFKNDKIHARFYTYGNDGKIIEKKRYRNGNEVLEKIKKENDENGSRKNAEKPTKEKKPSLFKRLFKKKHSEDKPQSPSDNDEKKVTSW